MYSSTSIIQYIKNKNVKIFFVFSPIFNSCYTNSDFRRYFGKVLSYSPLSNLCETLSFCSIVHCLHVVAGKKQQIRWRAAQLGAQADPRSVNRGATE